MKHSPLSKTRILLGSSGANAILESLRSHGYDIVVADLSHPSSAYVRVLLQPAELVLLDVSISSREVSAMIHDLCAAIGLCDVAPRLLCFSTAHRNAQFVQDIEKYGARYARVSDSATLHEAVELLLADIDDLRRGGPCFHVLHRFARGGCAPGEKISAVLCSSVYPNPQLPLAISERCVFNVLASHRRVALDARQIVATLNGEWFYRDHASNSGSLQRIKVRVPAVRVIIGRIRDAMSLKFAAANLQCNPFDVLESVPAIGNNRVIYKLNAEVRFFHSTE